MLTNIVISCYELVSICFVIALMGSFTIDHILLLILIFSLDLVFFFSVSIFFILAQTDDQCFVIIYLSYPLYALPELKIL